MFVKKTHCVFYEVGIVFTDEAQFTGDGIQNFQNQHLWADENSHTILPSHHQHQFTNIWAGICGDNLFGPHLLPNRLTGRNYKNFLENNMPDFLADVPLITGRNCISFQSRCPHLPESNISRSVDR
jgi:hypothetical protein